MIAKSTQQKVEELIARVDELENSKVKLKDLPIEALRNALLKMQPSDPGEILLNNSITTDLLASDAVTGEKLGLASGVVHADADLTLTTTPTGISNLTVTPGVAGDYLVMGTMDGNISVAGAVVIVGNIYVDLALADSSAIIIQPNGGTGRMMGTQVWKLTLTATSVLTLAGAKLINAGTAAVLNTHTSLAYLQVS